VAASIAGFLFVIGFPRSFWVVEAMLTSLLADKCNSASSPRILTSWTPRSTDKDLRSPAVLYGAGEAALAIAHAAVNQPEVAVPVGFLDDDPTCWECSRRGMGAWRISSRVLSVARSTGQTLITMSAAPGEVVRAIADAGFALWSARAHDSIARRHAFSTEHSDCGRKVIADGRSNCRAPVAAGVYARSPRISATTIWSPGQAGRLDRSWRDTAIVSPRKPVPLDRAEGPLYDVEREPKGRQRRGEIPLSSIEFHVGDITNRLAMKVG